MVEARLATAGVTPVRVLAGLRIRFRHFLLNIRTAYLIRVWGMDIGRDTMISLKANLDLTYPEGVHIGEGTCVAFDAAVLTHDYARGVYLHTHIGRFCMIGARSIIMPGVRIGDHAVVGAGSIVTRDVPAHSMVVGNPARVVRGDIMTGRWGRIIER